MPRYIIEHLEPEVYEWCILEYKHISSQVGKDNLLFTNTSEEKLKEMGEVNPKSVKELKFEKACILDPEAKEMLTPEKAAEFDNFIFGGILGDDPPKARTKEELPMLYPRFNLGSEQMSTDTAVIVTKLIVEGKNLDEIEFKEGVSIEICEGEEVHLPYKYLVMDGAVLLAPGLVKYLKEREEF